jgi:pyridoxal/pyridoxine/pyridoxamine kinase
VNQKNSILLKIVQLFKHIISTSLPIQSKTKTQNKIEFSEFENIIFKLLNKLKESSIQQFENILKGYFGSETGTEEEIVSKYHSKFKTIQQHLLSSINLFSQTHPNNNDIFSLSTFISKQSYNVKQSFQSILQTVNCNINQDFNIFEQISIFEKEIPQIQNSINKCFELVDNSNFDQSSQLILSSQSSKLYKHIESIQQYIF